MQQQEVKPKIQVGILNIFVFYTRVYYAFMIGFKTKLLSVKSNFFLCLGPSPGIIFITFVSKYICVGGMSCFTYVKF